MSSTIQPDTILRELAELWISLGKDTQPGPTSGVLRACTMTLVAMAEESEDPSNVWAVMAALIVVAAVPWLSTGFLRAR